jgi:hypothetical protein
MSRAWVPFPNAAISTMQTANSTETARQPMASTLARRIFSLPVLQGVLLVAGACLDRYWNLMNASLHQHVYSAYCFEGNMWWHLAVGKWILANHTWLTHDFYSFTAYGNPWIADQWLGEVLIAIFWGLGRIHALMVLLAALAGGILLLLYYYAYLRSGSVKAAFLACALLLPLAALPFRMRPQILGSAFLVVALISLERFRQGHRRALWVIPPLFLVWVNTHGTFVLGFVAMAVYWVSGLREIRLEYLETVAWKPDQRRQLATVFLLCLVACIITPYGTQMAAYPIQMAIFMPMIPQVVPEWHTLDFSHLYGQWFLVLLLLFVTGQLITRKKLQIAELVLLLFATGETILHARFMLLFVPVFAPLLALVLAEWVDKKLPGRERYALNAVLMAGACGAIVFLFPSRARLQAAVDLWNPTGAVRYLRQHPVNGHMLNFDDWGGYLIENLGQKVFIDGRADLYEPGGVLLDYLQIYYPQRETLFLLRKYHIDSCLMPPDSPLATLLAVVPGWKVAYRDPTSVLYIHAINPEAGISTEDIRKKVPQPQGNR